MKKVAAILSFLSAMIVVHAYCGTELQMRGRGSTGAGSRQVILSVVPPTAPLKTGDSQASFSIPASMNGLSLVAVGAHVYTAGTSGSPTFQIHKKQLSDGLPVDLLSTRITIDANEKNSSTAATPAAIDAASKAVAAGDEIFIDVDESGTGTRGGEIHMLFQ